MGGGASKNSGNPGGNEENLEHAGGQLYVSLQMDCIKHNRELVPHVYGSVPLIGLWDPSKALAMEREATSRWEISFVVPPNHETLEFKFLLKPKHSGVPCIIEEGSNRLLTGGALQGDARSASFRFTERDETLEYRVYINADRVSPVDLAASWRAYQENRQPSVVRGIPDVSINPIDTTCLENASAASLELELEHYEVPPPASCANSGTYYAANTTETPRSLRNGGNFSSSSNVNITKSFMSKALRMNVADDSIISEGSEALPPDLEEMQAASGVESKSVGTHLSLHKQDSPRGFYVDRGVSSSPRLNRSGSSLKKAFPAASGAVAAAAVADHMHGPKEDGQLAIVLVGLPARGKTFTAAKLTRYLRWLGHETKHFNVGKYRRLKLGLNQSAEFFRPDNQEGVDARNEVAALAMEDMIAWMQEGGQVGIFDATNSTRKRRNMLMKMAEGRCKIIFLETICNDEAILERNILLKIQQSPDYADVTDFEAGVRDFKTRLANYEKVYEPVEEGSYIKMIDMVSGQGGQIQVNTHLTPRPILLTRHGESRDNVRGRIGGDAVLSEAGELYAKRLANFVNKRLKSERTASIWTSTLQRTILTASHIVGFPKIQWRALDEIYAGVCDGMTYEEIKKNMPEEYEARKNDKLRYRYPRGESYLDVIQRLEPVTVELERQRAPVVVIAHQAILRALYAYFADRPLEEVPHIEIPLHTIIEIQMGVTGLQEKRYKLMD
ncbi:6-phosphofructo-2-kinase/fructose-2,6-bisphosphatase isoform X2 [Cryptomeria japonica]|uniref:6-phosphofructo-2-kinase/fructose-2, 6-bisphosphatase isoform X2 n=1 Tax=Cryptomeria japonica TaxID=3369 RepID=UPI0025ACD6D0|nr:6-phosphofructo-2-kinase/fructose-2,6-bisphosphatase isoform X2 [Cryptomeria japonica]